MSECCALRLFQQCQRTRSLGRHSITVPAIFAWADPDSVSAEQRRALPPGSRCDRVTSTLDVSATMLDALGSSPKRVLYRKTMFCPKNFFCFQQARRRSPAPP